MKNTGAIDLHLHSHYSDGYDSPEEIVNRLYAAGVKTAALTDHDTLQGTDQFISHGTRLGINIVTGVEVSTVYLGKFEAHILGFDVVHNLSGAEEFFKSNNAERLIRTKKVMQRLNESGILNATFDELTVKYKYPGYCVTLLHALDFMMVNDNYDYQTAKNAVLNTENLGISTDFSMMLSVHEGIIAIKELRGMPFLAHPGEFEKQIIRSKLERRECLESLLSELKAEGLVGIEAFHSKHSKKEESEYAILAKRMGLAVSAGSDYHGGRTLSREVGRCGIDALDFLSLLH